MTQQIRAVLQMVVILLVALAAILMLMFARQPPTVPTGLAAGAVKASPATIESGAPAVAVSLASLPMKTVPDAREAAKRQMIDEFDPPCFIEGDVNLSILPGAGRKLDERITAAKISGEGWVEDGELWLGSPEGAAKAFGASAVYADEQEVWIFIITDNGPRGRELRQSRSERGKVAWIPLDQVSPSPCPSEGK